MLRLTSVGRLALASGVTWMVAAFSVGAVASDAAVGSAPAAVDTSLRSRFGAASGERFLRSEATEDRLIGIERLGSAGTPQALAELVRALDLSDPGAPGLAQTPEERLANVRALAPHARLPNVRRALVRAMAGIGSALRESGPLALDVLARETAALALARSGDHEALRALGKALKSAGPAAEAAGKALTAHVPRDLSPVLSARGRPTKEYVRALEGLGDQRAFDELRSLVRQASPEVRARAALALTRLGHFETVPLARRLWQTERNPTLRLAAAEILIVARAAESAEVLSELYGAEETRSQAIDLFTSAPRPDLATQLVRRSQKSGTPPSSSLLGALGRAGGREASSYLEEALANEATRSAAAYALARMPGEHADAALERALGNPGLRRTALRAAGVRKAALDREVPGARAALEALLASRVAEDRAAAAFALAALEPEEVESLLLSQDVAVVVSAARTLPAATPRARRIAAERFRSSCDPLLASALAASLSDPSSAPFFSTSTLLSLAESGGAAAPLSARALGARFSSTFDGILDFLRRSGDPWLRAHVALGLGESEDPAVVGLLARSYRFETEPIVRHAIVSALGAREEAPRMRTLRVAESLDPDERVRSAARLALGSRRVPKTGAGHGTLWLDLRASRPDHPEDRPRAVVVRTSSGVALPLVADPDGVVIATGLPEGPVDVRVAALPQGGKACPDELGERAKNRDGRELRR